MPRQRYTFNGWALDCERGTLIGDSGDVALRPKSFDVLRFLVENAGRLVSRDEVLDTIWRGMTVTEESLTQCVSELRQALGDSDQRLIKTVPKRGYLFAGTVNVERHGTADPRLMPGAGPRMLDGPSVAVLPFANLSGDVAQEYLSDGITEDIISGLSYFSDLSVIARSSSFSYKGRAVDVRDIGQQLGVRYVVEGSVRRSGDQIRITAQLIDSQSGVRLWAKRFDQELGDIFAAQDEITESIVRIVVAHLGNAEGLRVSRKVPRSWTAYDLLKQGDQAFQTLEQTWLPHHLYKAHQLYAEAHKADPDNALICAKLALTFVRSHADPTADDCGNQNPLKHGHDMANRAVSLDPNLPYARARLGWAYFWMKQSDAAIAEFEKAAELNPNFSDVHFAAVLNFAGVPTRALDLLQKQIRLDPFHPSQVHAVQGHALYLLNRYAEAETPLREYIRRSPHGVLGHIWLAATLVQLDRTSEAKTIVAEFKARLPAPSLKRWTLFSLYRNRHNFDHMTDALRVAGLPNQ